MRAFFLCLHACILQTPCSTQLLSSPVALISPRLLIPSAIHIICCRPRSHPDPSESGSWLLPGDFPSIISHLCPRLPSSTPPPPSTSLSSLSSSLSQPLETPESASSTTSQVTKFIFRWPQDSGSFACPPFPPAVSALVLAAALVFLGPLDDRKPTRFSPPSRRPSLAFILFLHGIHFLLGEQHSTNLLPTSNFVIRPWHPDHAAPDKRPSNSCHAPRP